jgi:hypothetical protein
MHEFDKVALFQHKLLNWIDSSVDKMDKKQTMMKYNKQKKTKLIDIR